MDVFGNECTRSDYGVFAVKDEDKKVAWKIASQAFEQFLHDTRQFLHDIVCLRQIELVVYLTWIFWTEVGENKVLYNKESTRD